MIEDITRPVDSGLAGIRAVVNDYVALMKPGIMTLLLVTTLGAMLVAQQAVPSFSLVLITLLGGVLTAGGANVINCYIDRDIDAVMSRTRKRATANGRISPAAALTFGIALTLSGTLLLGLLVNWLAAGLALAGNLYYVFVYTLWLKRRTPHNIVIGGAAGAVPPLVGWAAVTGTLAPPAWILFAVIFYWTPPHFWALSLLNRVNTGGLACRCCRRVRRGRNPAPGPAVHRAPDRRDITPRPLWDGLDLRDRRGRLGRVFPLHGVGTLAPSQQGPGPEDVLLLHLVSGRTLRRDGGRQPDPALIGHR
jgi:hypothetical protein